MSLAILPPSGFSPSSPNAATEEPSLVEVRMVGDHGSLNGCTRSAAATREAT